MWTQTNLSKEKRFLGRVMASPQNRRNSGPLALSGEGKSQRGQRACLQGAADVGLSAPTGRRLPWVSLHSRFRFPPRAQSITEQERGHSPKDGDSYRKDGAKREGRKGFVGTEDTLTHARTLTHMLSFPHTTQSKSLSAWGDHRRPHPMAKSG